MASDGADRFDEATHLQADDAHDLQRNVQRHVFVRWCTNQRFLAEIR